MSTEKMRADFEKWATDRFWSVAKVNGFYDDPRAHDGWSAWQASRAAIEVELPKIVDKEWANTHAERSAMREAIGWCKKRIESLGLKVKP